MRNTLFMYFNGVFIYVFTYILMFYNMKIPYFYLLHFLVVFTLSITNIKTAGCVPGVKQRCIVCGQNIYRHINNSPGKAGNVFHMQSHKSCGFYIDVRHCGEHLLNTFTIGVSMPILLYCKKACAHINRLMAGSLCVMCFCSYFKWNYFTSAQIKISRLVNRFSRFNDQPNSKVRVSWCAFIYCMNPSHTNQYDEPIF